MAISPYALRTCGAGASPPEGRATSVHVPSARDWHTECRKRRKADRVDGCCWCRLILADRFAVFIQPGDPLVWRLASEVPCSLNVAEERLCFGEDEYQMTGARLIHIVDDDAAFRSAISRLLSVSGYEVADYDSAACFLGAIGNAKPGCILLDVQMPALGGLQLQEELSKLSHSWPIIFMTGHGDIPTSVRAIKAGAEDFLSKPVSRQTLLETIERAFARYSVLRESRDQLE